MAEQTDTSAEVPEEQASPEPSGKDWEAEAKRFQSIADKRDAENKTLLDKLDNLVKAQEERDRAELEEKEKFKELYQDAKAKLEAVASERTTLDLKVKLQDYISSKHPDYAPDFRWIAPHVSDEETIASVVDEYVKAHPKSQGAGTANLGNKGSAEGAVITVTRADLDDPARLDELLKTYPDILQRIESGEAQLT